MPQIPHSKYRHVHAVLRVDEAAGLEVSLEKRIIAAKVLWTKQDAILEVERLNNVYIISPTWARRVGSSRRL